MKTKAAPVPVQRYQPGGDIHRQMSHDYGTAAANELAAAAKISRAKLTVAFMAVRLRADYTPRR